MRVALVICLLVIGCLASNPYAPNSIEGGWSDPRFGGSLYFCVDDDLNVWGSYFNVGVYWGKTDVYQDIARGRW